MHLSVRQFKWRIWIWFHRARCIFRFSFSFYFHKKLFGQLNHTTTLTYCHIWVFFVHSPFYYVLLTISTFYCCYTFYVYNGMILFINVSFLYFSSFEIQKHWNLFNNNIFISFIHHLSLFDSISLCTVISNNIMRDLYMWDLDLLVPFCFIFCLFLVYIAVECNKNACTYCTYDYQFNLTSGALSLKITANRTAKEE